MTINYSGTIFFVLPWLAAGPYIVGFAGYFITTKTMLLNDTDKPNPRHCFAAPEHRTRIIAALTY